MVYYRFEIGQKSQQLFHFNSIILQLIKIQPNLSSLIEQYPYLKIEADVTFFELSRLSRLRQGKTAHSGFT